MVIGDEANLPESKIHRITRILNYFLAAYTTLLAVGGIYVLNEIRKDSHEIRRELSEIRSGVIRLKEGLVYVVQNLPERQDDLTQGKKAELMRGLESILGNDWLSREDFGGPRYNIELEIAAPKDLN